MAVDGEEVKTGNGKHGSVLSALKGTVYEHTLWNVQNPKSPKKKNSLHEQDYVDYGYISVLGIFRLRSQL